MDLDVTGTEVKATAIQLAPRCSGDDKVMNDVKRFTGITPKFEGSAGEIAMS